MMPPGRRSELREDLQIVGVKYDGTAMFCVQVPCYAFDTDGKKHDLSPLIKVSDGYLVDDGNEDIDFYINICRTLSEYPREDAEMIESKIVCKNDQHC